MDISRLKYVAVSVAVFVSTGFMTYSAIERTRAEADKNLAREGAIGQAMDQAGALLSELGDRNWDWKKVDPDLFRLQDQQYAESRMFRRKSEFSFIPDRRPEYDEVAFYCDLYARKNLTTNKGAEGKNHPEGFFIVGWKSGLVTKVPVAEVGMYDVADGRISVFPGMAEYDESLPRWGL